MAAHLEGLLEINFFAPTEQIWRWQPEIALSNPTGVALIPSFSVYEKRDVYKHLASLMMRQSLSLLNASRFAVRYVRQKSTTSWSCIRNRAWGSCATTLNCVRACVYLSVFIFFSMRIIWLLLNLVLPYCIPGLCRTWPPFGPSCASGPPSLRSPRHLPWWTRSSGWSRATSKGSARAVSQLSMCGNVVG